MAIPNINLSLSAFNLCVAAAGNKKSKTLTDPKEIAKFLIGSDLFKLKFNDPKPREDEKINHIYIYTYIREVFVKIADNIPDRLLDIFNDCFSRFAIAKEAPSYCVNYSDNDIYYLHFTGNIDDDAKNIANLLVKNS